LRRNQLTIPSLLAIVLLTSTPHCREDENAPATPPSNPRIEQATTELIFPESLRVADESVNMFVRTALTQCAKGNYQSFRALWSAKQDPISRAEYEEGWQAVHRIEVKGLQKALLASDEGSAASEPVYVLLVEVALDPAQKAGKREPLREIVMMLLQEHDQWRLATAPKAMRDWIKQQKDPRPNNATLSPTLPNP
jgi:hypothetical protein